jgi:hypothetical protein
MYSDKFVVAIKTDGKVLRETKDLVTLPFGSEFSVLVKNLNSRRAKFRLDIDGTDVLDGTEIIVNADSEVEMKRFIRNGNMNEGNAFKFIERTAAIEEGPRGIKVDDGVVRVEFWFEKEAPEVKTVIHNHHDYWWDSHHYKDKWTYGGTYSISSDLYSATPVASKGILRGMSASATTASAEFSAPQDSATMDSLVSDVGITVPGSKVEQKFHNVYGFNSEVNSNVIVLRLSGRTGDVQVSLPVTVKSKNICSTCSHTNKGNARFCNQCGTSLELV